MVLLRIFFIALSLVASSVALTVTDKKASNNVANFTPINFVFDSAGSTEAIGHKKDLYRRRRLPRAMARMPKASACCGDYPFCSCPKIDVPPAKVELDFAVIDPSKASACCGDYPFCSCPKL